MRGGVRDVEAVERDLRVGHLLGAEDGDPHDHPVGGELPAEHVEEEGERRRERGEHAEVLAEAERRLELAAVRDQVVELLDELRAEAAEEARRRHRPPDLQLLDDRVRVDRHLLGLQQPDLREHRQRADQARPAARAERQVEVGLLHRLERVAAAQPRRRRQRPARRQQWLRSCRSWLLTERRWQLRLRGGVGVRRAVGTRGAQQRGAPRGAHRQEKRERGAYSFSLHCGGDELGEERTAVTWHGSGHNNARGHAHAG